MAIRVNAGSDMKRADLMLVDPHQVEVKEGLRGRSTPPTEAEIIDMAVSLMDQGQLQPVRCRRIAGDRLELSLGFTRMAASRLIRDGFVDPLGNKRHDSSWLIKVQVVDGNDETAFIDNIVENCHRKSTSPIDDALNQNRLRERYAKTDDEIAALYRRSKSWVATLSKLVRLDRKVQSLVHTGDMSVQAALDLLDAPAESREQVIAAATKADGSVNGTEVRSQVRAHHLNDDGRAPPTPSNGKPAKATTRFKSRTMKEVRAYFDAKHEASKSERVQMFCAVFDDWLSGKCADKTLDNAFAKLVAR